nr:hypothetical protein [Tanacetum cinerariifolium]
WHERFMNYLEEQMDGEAMIYSIQNGDHPLHVVAQVSLAGTAPNAIPTLKDPKFWTAKEKKTRNIDRLARSLLIQGLSNDIYSLIDSNKTAKDLWDTLERQMRGSEYAEQDRKAAILYEYENFKATEEEQLLDTYLRYLQVINDLKKCGYKKDNYELNYKFLNNLQPEWKQYGDVNDALGYNKKAVMVTSDPLALVAEKTKITALSAKAFNRKKYCAKPTNNNLRTSSASSSVNKKLELQEKIIEKESKISELEECVSNKDLEIEKCLERLNDCENKLYKIGQMNQTIHMIMPSKDNLYNGRKGIGFENLSNFEKAKDLKPSLYDEKVIGLGYTPMFLTHSDEALKIEKFKRARENKIEFAYDYGNLNASYVNEKIIFSDDYFQEIITPDFEKIHSSFQQTSSLKPYVPTVILEKIIIDLEDEVVSLLEKEKANMETIESLKSKVLKMSCASENVENKTKRKRRKRKSLKQNDKQVNNGVLLANRDFVHFSDLDTFSSVRRPKHSGVIWKKKWSSNTFNVDLSSVSHSKLNKDVKRYSCKDLLICNNSHLRETSSDYVCNDAMNVYCNSRLYDSFDENTFFIFDDICLWIIESGCSKHMMGNRALLTNFVEKFLGTIRFGNNDFARIAGYGDVGLEVAFRKSTCFVRNEDGVDLLTGDRSSNLYTISLNELASNPSACLIAKGSSSQSWLWHQRLSHLNFATINNLVKNNLVQGLPNMIFKKDHLCSACEEGKTHQKHQKSKMTFASNKPLYLLHMDLCGPMHVESINGKRYVLVVVDDYSRYTWVFFLHSKDEASDVIISFIKKTQVNLQLQVQRVRTDNGMEFKNKTLAKFFDEENLQSISFTSVRNFKERFGRFISKFYDEYLDSSKIMKSSTTNVETSNVEIPSHEEEVFHESSESFQEESSSSSLNDDVQQISDEVETKDHPLHKIIGDPKSSVRTRALKDADWVCAMQDELDQFARLKEEVYVGQPLGFVSKQYPDHVFALDKALYRLKQPPQAWLGKPLDLVAVVVVVVVGANYFVTCLSSRAPAVNEPVVFDRIGDHVEITRTSSSVEQKFTTPAEKDVHVERYKEPAKSIQDVGSCRNVRRRLLPTFSSMSANASKIPSSIEPHTESAYTNENNGPPYRHCIPISTVFERFRNMFAANIESDYMSRLVTPLHCCSV